MPNESLLMRLGIAAALCLVAVQTALSQSGGPQPPGKMVDLGGYNIHLNCTGKGAKTVVLIAGAGDFSFDWHLVQSGLPGTIRVCSYDRPGTGWSDPGPTPRTMRQEAFELHEALKRSGIKFPVTLVGHSIGGLIARIYFDMYRRQVSGIVLVDPTTEDTKLNYQGKIVMVREGATSRAVPPVQTMRSSPPLPQTEGDRKQAEFNRQLFGPPSISAPYDQLPMRLREVRLWFLEHPRMSAQTDSFWAEELQAMHVARQKQPRPLGSVPLLVIIPEGASTVPQGVTAKEWAELSAQKKQQKTELADLSTNGKIIRAPKSGHHVQLDDPQIVVDAILSLLGKNRQ